MLWNNSPKEESAKYQNFYKHSFCEFLLVPINIATPGTILKQSPCNLNIGKIVLVQITGAYGSQIQDDTRTNAISNDDQYQQYQTVTLYEDTTYPLHVQLNCNRKSRKNSVQRTCSLSQKVNVWIDFNDNGYDDRESQVLRRARPNGNIPGNTYDLQLHIPTIDGRNTKAGSHRMRITVTPSEKYQGDCGTVNYQEAREYTVNIVPKATYSGNLVCLLIIESAL